jgi:DNA-directed RNA polymerase subunit beta'
MAVHLPLSDAAQGRSCRNHGRKQKPYLKPADGSPILHIEQDIVLGCYYLTYERPGKAEGMISHIPASNEASHGL